MPQVDNTVVMELARAFRWPTRRQRPSRGNCRRLEDQPILRQPRPALTLLAPDVVEAILDGRQPAEMTLAMLMEPFPVTWREQIAVGFRRL